MPSESAREAAKIFAEQMAQQREQEAQAAKEADRLRQEATQKAIDKQAPFDSVVADFMVVIDDLDQAFREQRGFRSIVKHEKRDLLVGHLKAVALGCLRITEDDDAQRGTFQPRSVEIGIARTKASNNSENDRLVIYSIASLRTGEARSRHNIDPLVKKPSREEITVIVKNVTTSIVNPK